MTVQYNAVKAHTLASPALKTSFARSVVLCKVSCALQGFHEGIQD
jgi:hypothetical protein